MSNTEPERLDAVIIGTGQAREAPGRRPRFALVLGLSAIHSSSYLLVKPSDLPTGCGRRGFRPPVIPSTLKS